MATTTPNFGWAVPTSSDLVKNGATAIETLGDSIDASMVDLKGGTTGQVLAKTSATDMDFTWTTPSGASSGPAFSAISAAEQLISANTNTKVTFGTEIFDTAGNFASSRFTPTTAGYYQINASLTLSSNSAGEFYGYFYKNGDRISRFSNSASALTNMTVSGGMVVAMNGSSDYLECYVAISNTGNPRIDSGSNQTQFSGVWIRGL